MSHAINRVVKPKPASTSVARQANLLDIFLASLLGISGLTKKVQGIIKNIRS